MYSIADTSIDSGCLGSNSGTVYKLYDINIIPSVSIFPSMNKYNNKTSLLLPEIDYLILGFGFGSGRIWVETLRGNPNKNFFPDQNGCACGKVRTATVIH